VTGDHATPSTRGVLHTGGPTPLLVAGPTVCPDTVTEWANSRPGRVGGVKSGRTSCRSY